VEKDNKDDDITQQLAEYWYLKKKRSLWEWIPNSWKLKTF
jgi:hypothetical protein